MTSVDICACTIVQDGENRYALVECALLASLRSPILRLPQLVMDFRPQRKVI